MNTTQVAVYLSVQRATCNAIKDICKRVNQSLLLQSLNDTRNCDQLLEPDDDYTDWPNETTISNRNLSFSRLKSMEGG